MTQTTPGCSRAASMHACSPRTSRSSSAAASPSCAASLDAEDVAQDVKVRLWRELAAGKTLPGAVPRGRAQGDRLDARRVLAGTADARAAARGLGSGRRRATASRSCSTATPSRPCWTGSRAGRGEVMELRYLRAARDRRDRRAARHGAERRRPGAPRRTAQAASRLWPVADLVLAAVRGVRRAGSRAASGPTCASTWCGRGRDGTSWPRWSTGSCSGRRPRSRTRTRSRSRRRGSRARRRSSRCACGGGCRRDDGRRRGDGPVRAPGRVREKVRPPLPRARDRPARRAPRRPGAPRGAGSRSCRRGSRTSWRGGRARSPPSPPTTARMRR